jgi:hypothetical protein
MTLPTKANVARPAAAGYGGLIEYGATDAESLYLRLAVGPGRTLQFQTVDPEDKAPNVAQNPEDMRAESGESFSRSDFGGGEGLRRAHRRDATEQDASRFFDSAGVETSLTETSQPEPITLLHSLSSLRTGDADATPHHSLVNLGGILLGVISDNERVDRTINPTAASPTWVVENPHDGEGNDEVKDIVALGDEVYAGMDTNGIHVRSSGGTWSHWSDLTLPGRLWAVKQRIIAASNVEDLYEARASTGSVLLKNYTGTIIQTVVDAGSVILVGAGHFEGNGVITAFADEDGELVEVGSTPMPGLEYPSAMAFASGVLLVATAEYDGTKGVARLYRGAVVGGTVRGLQLLRTWTAAPANNMEIATMLVTRNAVFFQVRESNSVGHVWRYDLTSGGVTRLFDVALSSGISYRAEGIAMVNDRLFVKISAGDLYREDTTYEDTGYLISPLADFYNAAQKAWVGARLQTGDLPTGTSVELSYSTDPAAIDDSDHASWTSIITATPAAPGASEETAITGVESRFIAGKVELTANDDNDETPEVLAFSFRGVQLPTEHDYVIPVNISDRLEMPGRKPTTVPGMGKAVYDALQDLVGVSVTATLLRSDEVVKGQIRQVSAPLEGIPSKGSTTVYAQVVIRGQRQ